MAKRNEIQEKLIKKAWEDAEFKKELMANPKAAIEKVMQITLPADIKIEVVEETESKMFLVLPADPAKTKNLANDFEEKGFEAQSYIP
ncbi:MAG: NHLP leader peptide family RiPP precursor [Bacillota bacterium]